MAARDHLHDADRRATSAAHNAGPALITGGAGAVPSPKFVTYTAVGGLTVRSPWPPISPPC